MCYFFFLILFCVLCKAQTVLPFGQYVSGNIAPGNSLIFTFTSPISDGFIIIDVLGNDGLSGTGTVSFTLYSPSIPVRFKAGGTANVIPSSGFNESEYHGVGVTCPMNVTLGAQYFANLTVFSSVVEPYSIRVSSQTDASLNNERIIEELTCCLDTGSNSMKQYYLDVPPGTNSITIFVLRDETRPWSTSPRLYVTNGACSTGSSNYFSLNSDGLTTVTIDSTTNPPLTTGRYYIGMPRPTTILDPFYPEIYRMAACLGQGCFVDIGTSIGTPLGTTNGANSIQNNLFYLVIIPFLLF